jgi:Rod binding domain-containing protein
MPSNSSFAFPTTPPLDWSRPASVPALSRGAKAAQDFESSLIGSLLESMEKTFATVPGQTDAPGQDEYSYLGQQALASVMSAAGGFGIAKMIETHLSGTTGK